MDRQKSTRLVAILYSVAAALTLASVAIEYSRTGQTNVALLVVGLMLLVFGFIRWTRIKRQ